MTFVADWVFNHVKENPLAVNERVIVSSRDGVSIPCGFKP